MKKIVYHDFLRSIVFLNFYHGRQRALPCPQVGKDQGADGNVRDPHPQEQSRQLRIQRCGYAAHKDWNIPRATVI